MKAYLFLLIFFSMNLFAQNFVDQTNSDDFVLQSLDFYSFDSSFSKISAKSDLRLKLRLTHYKEFNVTSPRLSGEMVLSQGVMRLEGTEVLNLNVQDYQGEIHQKGGRVEFSEFARLQLSQFSLYQTNVLRTIFRDLVARRSSFKNVVFSEVNFVGASLPGLVAEDVKFQGRTIGLNLRGCYLKNVEFQFDRIENLSFTECHLENVYVNGKPLTRATILRGE